jgi:hypothetical protein
MKQGDRIVSTQYPTKQLYGVILEMNSQEVIVKYDTFKKKSHIPAPFAVKLLKIVNDARELAYTNVRG